MIKTEKRTVDLPESTPKSLADINADLIQRVVVDTHRIEVLTELAGRDDYAMARRYAHLAPTHVAEYAKNLDRGLRVVRTFSGTPSAR